MGVKIYRIVVQRADIADISLIGNKKKVQQLIRQAKSAGYDLLSVSAGYREGTNTHTLALVHTHTRWHWCEHTHTHTGTGADAAQIGEDMASLTRRAKLLKLKSVKSDKLAVLDTNLTP